MTQAAPEPGRAGQPTDADGAHDPSGAGDRAATVADLAAAIAQISADGATGIDETDRTAGTRRLDRGGSGQAGRAGGRRSAPPPDDPAGPAGDPPGDPEAVARSVCLRLLTGQARSRADLADALHRRGIPDDVADRVLDRFTEVGLIDDAAYASAFVATKHRDRGWGRAALRRELRRKGIDGDLADQAVQAVDDESEHRRAAEVVAKRLDAAIYAGLPAARRRLLGALARRGYSASVATAVVNDALRGYAEPIELPDDGEPSPE